MEETLALAVTAENLDMIGAFMVTWGLRLLGAALILIAGYMTGRWVSRKIQGFSKFDPTLCSFLAGFARYTIYIVSVVAVLGQFGVQTASLLAVLGAAGLAIGLALQGTLSNVAAGTMLLVLRPFQVGDFIIAGGVSGTVRGLGLFGTELATPDNVYIYLPNSKIWNSDITNFSRNPLRRQDIKFGISYGDDIDKAIMAIRELLENDERILAEPDYKKPQVIVDMMGDSSVNLIARFWSRREDFGALKSDMTRAIKEELDKNGLTIPFPTRTVEMVQPEKGKAKKAA